MPCRCCESDKAREYIGRCRYCGQLLTEHDLALRFQCGELVGECCSVTMGRDPKAAVREKSGE